MQRLLIKCVNCILLIIIFIGIPAITGAQFGALRVSSTPKAQMLTLWGLSLAAVVNTVAALGWAKNRKDRTLCWGWFLAFGGLLGIEYASVHGYVSFDWLKRMLLWLQKHF
jgi:hypothetical protein